MNRKFRHSDNHPRRFDLKLSTVAILPGKSRPNVQCFRSSVPEHLAQISGSELSTAVGSNVLRYSVLNHSVGQHIDYIPAVLSAPRANRQALSRKLINRILHTHRPSIMRKDADEIVGPDVIGSLRPEPQQISRSGPKSLQRRFIPTRTASRERSWAGAIPTS